MVSGPAGSGKSTLAQTIADYCLLRNILGAYVVFLKNKSDPSTVLRTVAYQLACFSRIIAARMQEVLKDVNILSATLEAQFDILFLKVLDIVKDYIHQPIVIILDAMDECGSSNQRSELLEVLARLNDELPTESKLRFLITTRPESDITKTLYPALSIQNIDLIPSSSDCQRDVRAYLKHAMRDVLASRDLEHVPSDQEEFMNVLGDAADGVFIWASIAEKLVHRAANKPRRLQELVSDVKKGDVTLHNLYATVLEGLFDWDKEPETKTEFTRIMTLVLLGKEPFTKEMIDGMLGLDSDAVLSMLRPFLFYAPGQPIRIYHTSLYDYLTSCRGAPWFIDVDEGRLLLAHVSLDVMANRLHFDMGKVISSFLANDHVDQRVANPITADVRYVCRYWAQHLRHVPFSLSLLRKLSKFTFEQLLFWFEALSLTKDFYHIPGGCVRDVIAWTPVRYCVVFCGRF